MLFQKTIIKKYLGLLNDEVVSEAWNKFQTYFLDAQIQANILQSKEEQFQEGFLRELFVNVLGYTLNPSPNYNLITEKKNETNSKKADGTKTGYVIQKINYYPFGAQFCDGSTDSNVQSHKYNGKEFDKMHGLNTYDYSVSPYAYCHDNPVNRVDPDGKDDYFNSAGSFMYSTSNGSDVYVNNVLITDVSLNNDASRQAVANVVGYYANEAGISYYVKGGKSVGDSPSGTVGLAYQSNKDTFAFTRGNDIYVNKSGGHINSYLHDKYNIISTFEHEKEHKNNGHGFGGMTNRAHASVYAKHIGSKTFSKTTKDYQNVVVNSFIEMLKKSITEGATDKVIMSLISDANKGLSGTGMQIVYRRTGSDTDSYNLEVVK